MGDRLLVTSDKVGNGMIFFGKRVLLEKTCLLSCLGGRILGMDYDFNIFTIVTFPN